MTTVQPSSGNPWRAWAAIAAIVVVAAAFRIAILHRGALPKDDAYITYRYAENLAAGKGFVYNEGERVLGVTTPLYVLILATLKGVGFDTAGASIAIGVFAAAAIMVLLWRYGVAVGLGNVAFLAPALYGVHPNAVHSDLSGMESPLFALGVLATCYAALCDRRKLAAFLLGLLCVLRPEGALLALLYAAVRLGRRRGPDDSAESFTAAEAFLFAAPVVPWIAFAWAYFGSPVPNSIPAKLALYHLYDVGSIAERLQSLLGLRSLAGWGLTLGAGVGMAVGLRRRWGALPAGYLVVSLLALAASHVLLFFWYEAPLTPLLILFFTAGVAASRAWVRRRLGVPAWFGVVDGLAVFAGIGLAFLQLEKASAWERATSAALEAQHLRAARLVAARADLDDVVVADDIGYMGYAFRGRIVDRSGLVSPEVVPYNAGGRHREFLEQALAVHPGHWLFIAIDAPESREIVRSGLLDGRYALVADYDVLGPDDFRLYRGRGER